MSKSKAGGICKQHKGTNPKYFGVKSSDGTSVKKGNNIVTQKGSVFKSGYNTYESRNHTIHAREDGIVRFYKEKYKEKIYTFVKVIPNVSSNI